MGQVSCRKINQRESKGRRRIKVEHDEYNTVKTETFARLSTYNAILVDELRLLAQLSQNPSSSPGVENPEVLESAQAIANKRNQLESNLSESDDICNDFTSFSPGRYRFEDLLPEMPVDSQNVNSVHQLSASNTNIIHLELTNIGSPSSKCVFVETESAGPLLLVRAACYAFNDVYQICEQASQLGRLILCDLHVTKDLARLVSSQSTSGFLNYLMINHLGAVFQYSIIDGIPFIPLTDEEVCHGRATEYRSLNRWLESCSQKSVTEMWQEFMRLMRIGFKINSSPTAVFAFANLEGFSTEIREFLTSLVHQLLAVTDGGAMVLVGGKQIQSISSNMCERYDTIRTFVAISRTQSNCMHE